MYIVTLSKAINTVCCSHLERIGIRRIVVQGQEQSTVFPRIQPGSLKVSILHKSLYGKEERDAGALLGWRYTRDKVIRWVN